MTAYVALLRGINVGKSNRIAMPTLRDIVQREGCTNIQTWVNSGNVVFTCEFQENVQISARIQSAIARSLDMNVPVIVRSGAEMLQIVDDNPFPDRANDPITLHVAFLSGIPDPKKVDMLSMIDKGDDDYRVLGNNVYLSYPNKITGTVFMPNGLDKALSVISTGRNWRTVVRLAEMAAG